LNTLPKLEEIRFSTMLLAEMPDLSGIYSLKEIRGMYCKILSLNGIEKAKQLKKLEMHFWNFAPDLKPLAGLTNLEDLVVSLNFLTPEDWEKTAIHIDDLSNLTEIRRLAIGHYGNINLSGIQHLSKLKSLSLSEKANTTNAQYLGGLKDLLILRDVNISPSVTSLNFLSSLINLSELSIYGSGNTIDITPLRNLLNLEWLALMNFTVVNFHILNNLSKLQGVTVFDSNFYPETNNRLERAWVMYKPEGR
jgi:hypothetical protein